MTLRENAQFIDELRQHYRRLDGLLVKHKDRLGPIDVWEFNHPVIALRKLLFGGVGDPNLIGAANRGRPPGEPGNGCRVATASEVDPGTENSLVGGNPASPMSWPPSPEEIEEKGKLGAPHGASPVKLEVVR